MILRYTVCSHYDIIRAEIVQTVQVCHEQCVVFTYSLEQTNKGEITGKKKSI